MCGSRDSKAKKIQDHLSLTEAFFSSVSLHCWFWVLKLLWANPFICLDPGLHMPSIASHFISVSAATQWTLDLWPLQCLSSRICYLISAETLGIHIIPSTSAPSKASLYTLNFINMSVHMSDTVCSWHPLSLGFLVQSLLSWNSISLFSAYWAPIHFKGPFPMSLPCHENSSSKPFLLQMFKCFVGYYSAGYRAGMFQTCFPALFFLLMTAWKTCSMRLGIFNYRVESEVSISIIPTLQSC